MTDFAPALETPPDALLAASGSVTPEIKTPFGTFVIPPRRTIQEILELIGATLTEDPSSDVDDSASDVLREAIFSELQASSPAPEDSGIDTSSSVNASDRVLSKFFDKTQTQESIKSVCSKIFRKMFPDIQMEGFVLSVPDRYRQSATVVAVSLILIHLIAQQISQDTMATDRPQPTDQSTGPQPIPVDHFARLLQVWK